MKINTRVSVNGESGTVVSEPFDIVTDNSSHPCQAVRLDNGQWMENKMFYIRVIVVACDGLKKL